MRSPLLSRVALVVNQASRQGAAQAAYAEQLVRAAQGAGRAAGEPWGRLEVHPTTATTGVVEAMDAAMAGAPDLLVVGGGDGTLALAADRVAGTGTVLGVLPLGTANDAARTLGIPRDLPAAVDTLISGHVVDVDLGRAGSRAFLNVASVGLSVGVTQRLRPGLKRRLGPLAYPVATLAAYRAHEPFSARLEFPDGDHPALELDDLLQVAVGNGRHHGGGTTVSPTASIDDRRLDVYAIVRGRLREHVSIARLLKDGSFVEHERVHHLTTSRARLVTRPGLPVNLDGEVVAHTPLTLGVEPDAVHVVVPRDSTAARLDREPAARRRD